MADEAKVAGLKVDNSVLRTSPSPEGTEHDECKSSLFFCFAQQGNRDLL